MKPEAAALKSGLLRCSRTCSRGPSIVRCGCQESQPEGNRASVHRQKGISRPLLGFHAPASVVIRDTGMSVTSQIYKARRRTCQNFLVSNHKHKYVYTSTYMKSNTNTDLTRCVAHASYPLRQWLSSSNSHSRPCFQVDWYVLSVLCCSVGLGNLRTASAL